MKNKTVKILGAAAAAGSVFMAFGWPFFEWQKERGTGKKEMVPVAAH